MALIGRMLFTLFTGRMTRIGRIGPPPAVCSVKKTHAPR